MVRPLADDPARGPRPEHGRIRRPGTRHARMDEVTTRIPPIAPRRLPQAKDRRR
jgi:hypothetical protein